MEDLSLHILDIVENSLRANAQHIAIRLTESHTSDLLVLEVADDGDGMDEQSVGQARDPFFSTKDGKRIGLGLSFLAQAAEETGGAMQIESRKGAGTTITARFGLRHIDRKPFGNLEQTLRCVKATHPEVTFSFIHECS